MSGHPAAFGNKTPANIHSYANSKWRKDKWKDEEENFLAIKLLCLLCTSRAIKIRLYEVTYRISVLRDAFRTPMESMSDKKTPGWAGDHHLKWNLESKGKTKQSKLPYWLNPHLGSNLGLAGFRIYILVFFGPTSLIPQVSYMTEEIRRMVRWAFYILFPDKPIVYCKFDAFKHSIPDSPGVFFDKKEG